jgi:D-glycero-alpha-D-manno-heptose-7-phosphate kinase
MILTRCPLRISLGGGGTDLPSYYEEHGGFLVAGAIDKYIHINIHRRFIDRFLLKYSQIEESETIAEIKHPIIRESLSLLEIKEKNLEMTSMADIPAGTGLGSSGSFTTALLKALHAWKRDFVHPHELAEQACEIEIERLREPIGKQDQFIAAYGGITAFTFHKDGRVEAPKAALSEDTIHDLEDNLLLFFTGYSRSASAILKDQKTRSEKADSTIFQNLHRTKDLGLRSLACLEAGDTPGFAALMHEHWRGKRARSSGMSNDHINAWYDLAMTKGPSAASSSAPAAADFSCSMRQTGHAYEKRCAAQACKKCASASTSKARKSSRWIDPENSFLDRRTGIYRILRNGFRKRRLLQKNLCESVQFIHPQCSLCSVVNSAGFESIWNFSTESKRSAERLPRAAHGVSKSESISE